MTIAELQRVETSNAKLRRAEMTIVAGSEALKVAVRCRAELRACACTRTKGTSVICTHSEVSQQAVGLDKSSLP